MDRDRFSAIAHTDLLYWNPAPEHALRACLDAAAPPAGGRALDIGCGRAEALLLAAARFDLRGVGVDPSPRALALADARRAAHGAPSVDLVEGPFATARWPGPWDLILCVGSSHALGGTPALLTWAREHLAPGGHLLVGDLYWRARPDPAYLAFFGCTEADMPWRADLTAQAEAAGFALARGYACTVADWDRYEDRYAANVERFLADHPDDPDAGAMRARITAWRQHYLAYGRDTLGFALDLYRRG